MCLLVSDIGILGKKGQTIHKTHFHLYSYGNFISVVNNKIRLTDRSNTIAGASHLLETILQVK